MKITGAPLPQFADLIKSLIGRAGGMTRLSAPWAADDQTAYWLSRSAHSLAAIARWKAEDTGKDNAVIWVPDYFCNGSLGALRDLGTEIVFYPIAETLDPDWQGCRELAGTKPPDLFLLVHYFGRSGDAGGAVAFCKTSGADLIEDAAHSLMAGPGVGDVGRFTLFSPYKTLGLPDGAIVLTRGLGPDQQALFANIMKALPVGNPPQTRWVIKRLIQIFAPQFILPTPDTWGPVEYFDDPVGPTDIGMADMSDVSTRLLECVVPRIDDIARERNQNAARLYQALSALGDWTPVVDGSEGFAPYRLVLRCTSPEIAAARYRELRENGVPLESWPDMPPEVMAEEGRYAQAILLRRTLMCFSVHQGLNADRIIRLLSR